MLDYLKIAVGVLAGLALYGIYDIAIGTPATERAAREGYVLLAEKTSAEAQATEMQRQRDAAAQALEEHRKRLASARAAEAAARDRLEMEITENEKRLDTIGRACRLDDADVDFLRNH
ncbi:hypothetical protein ACCS79_03505 [Rhizobium johnstonii]|uniref:hypothetical protein n=1 Tax=Rhizobium johnstonii TaxID=3019933 RepID=UPI003F9D96BD